MQARFYIYAFFFLVLFSSCTKEEPAPDPNQMGMVESSAKELNSISVKFASLSGKETSSQAIKSGSSFVVSLPSFIDITSLNVTINSSPKSIVKIGNQTISNGEGNINLSNLLSITVEAEDGSTKEFTLSAIKFDEAFAKSIEAFRTKWDIIGMSFAISYKERLIYADGFGMADVQNDIIATAETSFRLASVSKSITGVAIMKLVEEGKIELDDKVFGPEGILNYPTFSEDYHEILVAQLLNHTSGLATNDANDPAFQFDKNWNTEKVVQESVKSQAISSTPGTEYLYSNVAFMAASLIIEKVTNMSYDEYLVKIMREIDIEGIRETSNDPNNLKPTEGKSYDNDFSPYDINLNRIKGAGGLIASAKDLVKLVSHIDGGSRNIDFLSSQSIETMTAHNAHNYALGWSVDGNGNWWHIGSVQGAFSELQKNSSGISVAFISNTTNGQNYNQEFFDVSRNIINSVTNWPSYNLF